MRKKDNISGSFINETGKVEFSPSGIKEFRTRTTRMIRSFPLILGFLVVLLPVAGVFTVYEYVLLLLGTKSYFILYHFNFIFVILVCFGAPGGIVLFNFMQTPYPRPAASKAEPESGRKNGSSR